MSHTTPIRQTTLTIHSAEITVPSRSLAPTKFAEHRQNSPVTSWERTTSVKTTTIFSEYQFISTSAHVGVKPNKETVYFD